MADLIRLPRRFFVDHLERDLETPVIVRETRTHVWVAASDPALPELESDAEYYADPAAFERVYFGLCMSARATLRAIRAHRKGF